MSNFLEPIKAFMGGIAADKILPPKLATTDLQKLMGISGEVMKKVNVEIKKILPNIEKDLKKLFPNGIDGLDKSLLEKFNLNNSDLIKQAQKLLDRTYKSFQDIVRG